MTILGITGGIGHGKSSLAAALTQQEPGSVHLEAYHLIAEVADALHAKLRKVPAAGDFDALNEWLKELPAILKDIAHVTVDFEKLAVRREDLGTDPLGYQKLFQHLDALQTDPKLAKAKITDENKQQYRPILQWLGGYLVAKASPSIWWDEMIRRAQKAGKQGASLVVLGGVRYPSDAEVIKAADGKILHILRPDMQETDLQDPTERERQNIKADVELLNNGSLTDLKKCAKSLLKDLRTGKLKPKYQTKSSKK